MRSGQIGEEKTEQEEECGKQKQRDQIAKNRRHPNGEDGFQEMLKTSWRTVVPKRGFDTHREKGRRSVSTRSSARGKRNNRIKTTTTPMRTQYAGRRLNRQPGSMRKIPSIPMVVFPPTEFGRRHWRFSMTPLPADHANPREFTQKTEGIDGKASQKCGAGFGEKLDHEPDRRDREFVQSQLRETLPTTEANDRVKGKPPGSTADRSGGRNVPRKVCPRSIGASAEIDGCPVVLCRSGN